MADYDDAFDEFIDDEYDSGEEYIDEIEGAADEDLLLSVDPDIVDDSETDIDESGDEIDEIDEEVDEVDEAEDADEELNIKDVSNFNREIIVVKPENRRTSNVLSKFEMTELVSIRATQIAQFANCMVDTTGIDDPILFSRMELIQRKCPLVLRRKIGELKNLATNTVEEYYEYWNPNEMQFSVTYEV